MRLDEFRFSWIKMVHVISFFRFIVIVFSIYAIGDCIHGPMLAHKAEDEGEHEFGNISSSTDWVLFYYCG